MTPYSRTLATDDAVRLVELMAKVAACQGDHAAKKRLLLGELCELVDADRWNWALNAVSPQGEPRHAGVLQGGFTAEGAAKLSAGTHHPESMEVFGPSYRRIRALGERVERGEPLQPITVRGEDHPGYDAWKATSESARILREAGVGPFITSVCPIDATQSSSVTLFRSPGREPFTARQRDLVHVLMRGVVWLHTTEWPAGAKIESLTELSPTHTVMLTLLVKGYSRQEIAEARGLTVNTVSTYSRDLYRHFGVRSQRELTRRFLQGEGSEASPI
ncbi:MAG: helix-turn-helix transcriptional regulator [Planctomycetota bacterium]